MSVILTDEVEEAAELVRERGYYHHGTPMPDVLSRFPDFEGEGNEWDRDDPIQVIEWM